MPDRRYEDNRMDRLEATVDKLQEDVTYIKTKIDNGFSHSIANTENKVSYIDERNREDHIKLIDNIDKMSAKFDKVLWICITGAVSLIGGIVLALIRGVI
jgi:hypothetical protein